MKLSLTLALALFFFLPCPLMASLKFHSEQLKVMDVVTLQRIVRSKLQAARKALITEELETETFSMADSPGELSKEEGAQLIQDSLKIIFARPEPVHSTGVILKEVELVAIEYGGFFPFIQQVAQEALGALAQSGTGRALLRDQNTYLYILNNMMTEIKPLVSTKEGQPYRRLIENIRDQEIHFSQALKSHRVMSSMDNIVNPSRLAEEIVGKKPCGWWEFLWC